MTLQPEEMTIPDADIIRQEMVMIYGQSVLERVVNLDDVSMRVIARGIGEHSSRRAEEDPALGSQIELWRNHVAGVSHSAEAESRGVQIGRITHQLKKFRFFVANELPELEAFIPETSALSETELEETPASDKSGHDWRNFKACAELDQQVLRPKNAVQLKAAKLLCAACRVRIKCLDEAITADNTGGSIIRGGFTQSERLALLAKFK